MRHEHGEIELIPGKLYELTYHDTRTPIRFQIKDDNGCYRMSQPIPKGTLLLFIKKEKKNYYWFLYNGQLVGWLNHGILYNVKEHNTTKDKCSGSNSSSSDNSNDDDNPSRVGGGI